MTHTYQFYCIFLTISTTASGGISGGVPPSRRRRISNGERSPTLGGAEDSLVVCLHCFCDPCVTEDCVLPCFVRGSAALKQSRLKVTPERRTASYIILYRSWC